MRFLKRAFHQMFHHLGLEIHRIGQEYPAIEHKEEYDVITPEAQYQPWRKDAQFLEVFAGIQGYTLVDQYRCYELWKAVEQSAKLETGSIIEVGVWRGGTGALMARQAQYCGIKDPVYLCDTFTGVVKAGEHDTIYKGGEHGDTSMTIVKRLLADMQVENVELLKGIFPEDTSKHVADQKFRLCHIDVDVYQSAKDVVEWLWERMVPGGMIIYDDYGMAGIEGITKFVEEQMALKDRLIFYNLNGHAIVVKR